MPMLNMDPAAGPVLEHLTLDIFPEQSAMDILTVN